MIVYYTKYKVQNIIIYCNDFKLKKKEYKTCHLIIMKYLYKSTSMNE